MIFVPAPIHSVTLEVQEKKRHVTLMPYLPRPIASRSNLYLRRTSPLHRKEGVRVTGVFPSCPSVSCPPRKFRCVRGRVDLPNPHSTPSKNSRGRAPVKSGDLGALGGGQTGQFCPKTKAKTPRCSCSRQRCSRSLEVSTVQSAQIGRHFQGIFLLRTGNPQFSLASSALVSSQYIA